MVPMHYKDNRGHLAEHMIPMVLPHEAFHHLYAKDPTMFRERFFGTDGSAEVFWNQVTKTMPYLTRHPGYANALRDPQHSIPLRIHGDEVAYNKSGGKIMCCILCTALTRSTSMAIATSIVFAMRSAVVLSFDPLLEILAWSFAALLSGTMPDVDHNGCAFVSKQRQKLAGRKVAGPYIFLLCQLVGDWQFLVETLSLDATYSRDVFCFLCSATKSPGPACGWQYGPACGWLNTLVSDAAFRAQNPDLVWYLFQGFCLQTVQLDLMHIICLGIYHWILGASLWELVIGSRWLPHLQGPFRFVRSMQLRAATDEFRRWANHNKVKHSQLAFSLSSLSMTSLKCLPYLKGKAANLLAVADWLTEVCATYVGSGNDHDNARANALWGYSTMIKTLQAAPIVLGDDHCKDVEVCRQAALYSHGALSWAGALTKSGTWLTKPKMHLLDHCIRRALRDRVNPTYFWVFSDESFVGMIRNIARRCHGGVALERTLCERWMILFDVSSSSG